MNFRVFLLIGAMGVFGALWASDGRYQTKQVEMARADRARSASGNAFFVAKIKSEMIRLSDQLSRRVAEVARTSSANTTATAAPPAAPLIRRTDEAIAPNALLGRLVVAWVLNVDPGNGVSVITWQASLAKSPFEERYCLLRFRTRQGAFFASRRASAFLFGQLSVQQLPERMGRTIIREIPIEETQATHDGDRRHR